MYMYMCIALLLCVLMLSHDCHVIFSCSVRRAVCCLVQQGNEKIDRTRAHACSKLMTFIHHDPPIPHVPQHQELSSLFDKWATCTAPAMCSGLVSGFIIDVVMLSNILDELTSKPGSPLSHTHTHTHTKWLSRWECGMDTCTLLQYL